MLAFTLPITLLTKLNLFWDWQKLVARSGDGAYREA